MNKTQDAMHSLHVGLLESAAVNNFLQCFNINKHMGNIVAQLADIGALFGKNTHRIVILHYLSNWVGNGQTCGQ